MLSTASALLTATEEAIIGETQMLAASFIVKNHKEFTQDEMAKAMFMYATEIASAVTDKVTKVLLTETQFKELLATLGEIEAMRDEVLGGN
jgi:hypothetical protein